METNRDDRLLAAVRAVGDAGVVDAVGALANDPVIASVRAARDAYAAIHGQDLSAIFEDIRAAQEASGRVYESHAETIAQAETQVAVQVTAAVRQVEGFLGPALERLYEWSATAAPFLEEFERAAEAAAETAERVRPFLEELHQWNLIGDALNDVGWLPHHSVPYRIVVECEGDTARLDNRVGDYYRARWNEIRDDMESGLEYHHLDDESRAAFREALSAHEAGLYRGICRTLFPEIERMIGAGNVGSRRMLDKLLDESRDPTGRAFREIYNRVLFDRLTRHVYERVLTADEQARFERDPVPNRHAAVHGLVAYSTHKHSMNMLILTDYVFRVLPPLEDSHT
ncbi:MAG: hypothetical protein OXG58_04060 [Gemmatimonadetes bacterium]|nr:hypothetical protein [Gemmatimonadota bacterium]